MLSGVDLSMSSMQSANPAEHNWVISKWHIPLWACIVCLLTRVFPSFVPLDEADNEEDQDEQSDGTHEPNEPSLSGDIHLPARHSCPEERRRLNTHRRIVFIQWDWKLEVIIHH